MSLSTYLRLFIALALGATIAVAGCDSLREREDLYDVLEGLDYIPACTKSMIIFPEGPGLIWEIAFPGTFGPIPDHPRLFLSVPTGTLAIFDNYEDPAYRLTDEEIRVIQNVFDEVGRNFPSHVVNTEWVAVAVQENPQHGATAETVPFAYDGIILYLKESEADHRHADDPEWAQALAATLCHEIGHMVYFGDCSAGEERRNAWESLYDRGANNHHSNAYQYTFCSSNAGWPTYLSRGEGVPSETNRPPYGTRRCIEMQATATEAWEYDTSAILREASLRAEAGYPVALEQFFLVAMDFLYDDQSVAFATIDTEGNLRYTSQRFEYSSEALVLGDFTFTLNSDLVESVTFPTDDGTLATVSFDDPTAPCILPEHFVLHAPRSEG